MFILTLILASLGITCCLVVVPEWTNITYMNEKYIQEARTYIRRYSRKGPYTYNVLVANKQTWGNNISIHVLFTQYLHNEYRPSFIDVRFKLCDFLNNEQYIGGMIKKMLSGCPVPKGSHKMTNMTLDTAHFAYVFPFEKGGSVFDLYHTDTEERILSIVYHATFTQKPKP